MSDSTKQYIYGARDTSTGKLVSNITNPRRKYWDKEGNARNAINYYNSHYANRELNPLCNKGKQGMINVLNLNLWR